MADNSAEGFSQLTLAVGLAALALAVFFGYRERARLRQLVARLDATFNAPSGGAGASHLALFLYSFACLYVEVMMIRWVGTEVRVFAFFQNLALIASFLGFGLGCYASNRPRNSLVSLAAMAALVALVRWPSPAWNQFLKMLSSLLSLSPDAALWGFLTEQPDISLWDFVVAAAVIALFLFLLVLVMMPLGQWVGACLDASRRPVTAYSVNLAGSIAGIWAFAALTYFWLPPEAWFIAAFALLALAPPFSSRRALASLALAAVTLGLLVLGGDRRIETHWSPYQKLSVERLADDQYIVRVNNTGYMTIAGVTPELIASSPAIATRIRRESSYDSPFRFAARADDVLIVGAGAGNDAAAALRNGARHVDAVEIDPVIRSLGVRLHPEHPYTSPQVRVIVNDARAFMRVARERYDVVLFGLLDSHTQFSDFSNMRIDNYVYTEQAFREARRLLKPDGILVVKFEVRDPWTWMGGRFAAMLERVFDRPPIVYYAPEIGPLIRATVFVTSNDPGLWQRAAEPALASWIAAQPPDFPLAPAADMPLPTDDWPYVYHRARSIPRTFLTVSLILLAMAVGLVRKVLDVRRGSTWLFFALGAGFLLLETQLVSRLALYFGTTWMVNCVALTAILLVLVLSNLFVLRFRPSRLEPYYVLLLAGLVGNYFFPWHALPYGARAVGLLLSAAYALPVFCAGVVFTEMFARAEDKSRVFGANIVGAVAGGLAQNLSFIFGMKALLVIAALFYACAGLLNRRARGASGAAMATGAS